MRLELVVRPVVRIVRVRVRVRARRPTLTLTLTLILTLTLTPTLRADALPRAAARRRAGGRAVGRGLEIDVLH